MLYAVLSTVFWCWVGGVAVYLWVVVYDWHRSRISGCKVPLLRCAKINLHLLVLPVWMSAVLAVAAVVGGWK